MSGVRGNIGKLRDFARATRELPHVVRHKVADAAAPLLGTAARASFDAGLTAYDTARPPGENGPLSLVKSGATRASLGGRANGSLIVMRLGPRYVRYLIRFGILPRGGAAMPARWSKMLRDTAHQTIAKELAS